MAVYMVGPVTNIINTALDRVTNDAVNIAKSNAPVGDTGQLSGNIHSEVISRWGRRVTTSAYGPYKGFEYPARIEAGEEVHPRPGNKKGLYYRGRWHRMSRASNESHFMEHTMQILHI